MESRDQYYVTRTYIKLKNFSLKARGQTRQIIAFWKAKAHFMVYVLSKNSHNVCI